MLLFGLGSSVLTLLSLTLAASGGEDSDAPRLGGEGSLPSFMEKRRVSMGRAHVFWRVKAEKKSKVMNFFTGGRELKGGSTYCQAKSVLVGNGDSLSLCIMLMCRLADLNHAG